MTNPPLILLQDISYRYSGTENLILNQINISLKKNQRVGLIGPNGCGKTTLFHLIMGLLKPQSGTLRYKGTALEKEKDFRILRREVGLLFQDADDQLFSPTVLEDVAFGPLNLGAAPAEAKYIAQQTLTDLGLIHLEKRITHHLSGGEKKLVSLATILAMRPRALLLDEPTNNLDPETQTRLIEIITGLDLAFMIISHDYDFLVATCEDLYLLDKGHVTPGDTSHLHTHHHAHPHGRHPHKHGDS